MPMVRPEDGEPIALLPQAWLDAFLQRKPDADEDEAS